MNKRDFAPNLIIVMGVSGCGKSTVAAALAEQLNYQFVEADDFHPPENKAHMASGQALTDAMREPWIALLQAHLKQAVKAQHSCVLSFSGLRRMHRAKMRDLPFNTVIICLEGPQELISQRMNARAGHFMPTSLLNSQFATLEPANKDEKIFTVNIDQALDDMIKQAADTATANLADQSV